MSGPNFELLHECDVLRLSYVPRRTKELVVAFTGARRKMGTRSEEFTSAGRNGQRHSVYVVDKIRGYFSAPGIRCRIISIIKQLIDQAGIERVFTLGNSMGGFGAILFGESLSANTTVAFVPNVSSRRNSFGKVPDRVGVAEFNLSKSGLVNLRDIVSGDVPLVAIYGDTDPRDQKHMWALRDTGKAGVWRVSMKNSEIGGHGVARFLKQNNLMAPLIAAAFNRDWNELGRLLRPISIRLSPVRRDFA